MRIEKLNENKIRIFLNLEDLQEKDIDLHTFMSNSLDSQDLFLELLNRAENEVGFKTNNYKLVIEALASSDGNFIFTITRVKPENSTSSKAPNVKPRVKRQYVKPNKLLSIYSFNTFDDFCDFCNYVDTTSMAKYINKCKNSSLICFKDKYYLILNDLKLSLPELKSFYCITAEFASIEKNESLLARKLQEYGKTIIAKDAIATCLKYFGNNKELV